MRGESRERIHSRRSLQRRFLSLVSHLQRSRLGGVSCTQGAASLCPGLVWRRPFRPQEGPPRSLGKTPFLVRVHSRSSTSSAFICAICGQSSSLVAALPRCELRATALRCFQTTGETPVPLSYLLPFLNQCNRCNRWTTIFVWLRLCRPGLVWCGPSGREAGSRYLPPPDATCGHSLRMDAATPRCYVAFPSSTAPVR